MEHSVTDMTIVAGLLGLVTALVELAKGLIHRYWPKGDGDGEVLRDSREKLDRLLEIYSAHDNDGVPLVYSPRSVADNQRRIVEILRDVAHSQERCAAALERLDEKIDDVRDVVRNGVHQAKATR